MRGWRGALAKTLMVHAARMMPAAREEWARAMLAEVGHLAPREQLPFALGCVWSSYRERLMNMKTFLAAGRWGISLALIAATAVCFRTAYALAGSGASALILALGLICLASILSLARLGFRRLPAIALAGLAAATLAVLAIGDPRALADGALPSSPLYRAILLEQLLGWATLFGLAHLLLAAEARGRSNG